LKLKEFLKKTIIKICRRLGETSPLLIDLHDIKDGENASHLLETMRLGKMLIPKTTLPPANKCIVICAPHPDDEVIGMGGTLIKMREQGCEVHVLYFTLADHKDLRPESEKLSKTLDFTAHYLGHQKHNIALDKQSLESATTLIEKIAPDHLFLPFMLDDHDDHRRVSEFLYHAFKSKTKENFDIWAYQVYTPLPLNTVIDITTSIDKKCTAIKHYKSQFTSRDWAHFAKGLNAFNVRFLSGTQDESYAEVFHRSSLSNYIKLCERYFGTNPEKCYEFQNYQNR